MDDTNPYAAPSDVETTVSADPSMFYGRMNGMLAVRDGAELPGVCVVTNEITGDDGWRRKSRFTWLPVWFLFIPCLFPGAVPLLVNSSLKVRPALTHVWIYAAMTVCAFPILWFLVLRLVSKRVSITYSLHRLTRRRFIRRRLIGAGLLLLAVALIVSGLILRRPNWMIGALLPFIAGVAFASRSHAIYVSKYKQGWFLLNGASPEFIATLPELPPFS